MTYYIVEYITGYEVQVPYLWFWRYNAVDDFRKFATQEEARQWIELDIHRRRVNGKIVGKVKA